MVSSSKVRESNFELMRIISIFFIILWHILIHGNVLNNCTYPAIKVYLKIIQFIIIVHVNSFIILTGYFQSKSQFKLSKFLSLIFQVIFYSFFIYSIFLKFNLITDYNIIDLISSFLPSSVSCYWFIKCYLILYLLSDAINIYIDRISKGEYKKILLLLFVVFSIVPFVTGGKVFYNDGGNLYNFIFLYLIGGYLRKYPLKDNYYFNRFSVNGYRMTLLFIFFILAFSNYLINFFALHVENLSNLLHEFSTRVLSLNLTYSSPFVILQTICYFELFRIIKIKNKLINYLSSCVFGIYLFHDNYLVRKIIYVKLGIDSGKAIGYKMIIYMFFSCFLIFSFGVIIESLRKILIYLLCKNKYIKKIIFIIKNFLLSFNYLVKW